MLNVHLNTLAIVLPIDSNTTFVNVKQLSKNGRNRPPFIQIQLLLMLNGARQSDTDDTASIQIQLLLMLNAGRHSHTAQVVQFKYNFC